MVLPNIISSYYMYIYIYSIGQYKPESVDIPLHTLLHITNQPHFLANTTLMHGVPYCIAVYTYIYIYYNDITSHLFRYDNIL